MKKSILTIFLLIPCLFFGQINDTITIEKNYQYTTDKPILIRQSSVVLFQADSIYLVNPGRYQFYEEIRLILNEDLGCNEVFKAYENSIERNSKMITDLLVISKASEGLTKKMLSKSNSALLESIILLSKNDQLLRKTQNDFNLYVKEVKKKDRKKYLNYVIIGLSGITAGIIITKI